MNCVLRCSVEQKVFFEILFVQLLIYSGVVKVVTRTLCTIWYCGYSVVDFILVLQVYLEHLMVGQKNRTMAGQASTRWLSSL